MNVDFSSKNLLVKTEAPNGSFFIQQIIKEQGIANFHRTSLCKQLRRAIRWV